MTNPTLYATEKLINELLCHVRYDKEAGILYWKDDAPNHNVRGKPVSPVPNGCGYLMIIFKGRYLKQHRVIFYMHHRYLPACVDHIDLNRMNNKIENLRAATKAQNCSNAKLSTKNTSGHKGVSYKKSRGKWCAQITHQRNHLHIGLYDTKDMAILAINKARHELHGEFANHG